MSKAVDEKVSSSIPSVVKPIEWQQALARFILPLLVGISLLEWGLFCQHVHWDISSAVISITLLTLGFLKFGLVLARYIDGQAGATFKDKFIQVLWMCSSLPLLFYVLMA